MYETTIKRGESAVVHVPWPALKDSPRPIQLKPISKWCVVSIENSHEIMTLTFSSGLSIGAVDGGLGVFIEFDSKMFTDMYDRFTWTLNVKADDVEPDCDADGLIVLVNEYEPSDVKPARPWDFFKAGVHHATEEQRLERMAICEACPELTMAKTCKKCHCFMPMKTRLAHASCPIGKWAPLTVEKPVEFYGAEGS